MTAVTPLLTHWSYCIYCSPVVESHWYGMSLSIKMWSLHLYCGHAHLPDALKLTGLRTFADKKWVEPVKFLCIVMFKISKIRPKSLLDLVKAQKFLTCMLGPLIARLEYRDTFQPKGLIIVPASDQNQEIVQITTACNHQTSNIKHIGRQ